MAISDQPDEGIAVSPAAFPHAPQATKAPSTVPLSRFYALKVGITAELGRLQLSLGDLIELNAVDIVSEDARLDIVVRYTVRATGAREQAEFRREP